MTKAEKKTLKIGKPHCEVGVECTVDDCFYCPNLQKHPIECLANRKVKSRDLLKIVRHAVNLNEVKK